jgi:uncharacterized protein YicC (UPF0701 family)
MNLRDMALAHLNNVQNTLVDLYKQKEKVEEEISRLTSYLQEGSNLLKEQGSNVETPVSE